MNATQIRLANDLYRKGNNDGSGYAPDEPEVGADASRPPRDLGGGLAA